MDNTTSRVPTDSRTTFTHTDLFTLAHTHSLMMRHSSTVPAVAPPAPAPYNFKHTRCAHCACQHERAEEDRAGGLEVAAHGTVAAQGHN